MAWGRWIRRGVGLWTGTPTRGLFRRPGLPEKNNERILKASTERKGEREEAGGRERKEEKGDGEAVYVL